MDRKKSLDQIFSLIAGLNNEKWDAGLNGRSAVLLFFFMYSQLRNDTDAYNKGIELLEYELNNLEDVTNISLFNGLSGIAWNVNYLANKGIIDINSDDFLPELLEKDFKELFFLHDILLSEDHFKTNSDIFFYFAERYATTRCEVLKSEYQIFLYQGLIFFTHSFFQIEKHKLYEHFKLSVFISFIKLLNFINSFLPSSLLNSLLSRSIYWCLSEKYLSSNNLSLFLETADNINDSKLIKKLKDYQPYDNDMQSDVVVLETQYGDQNIGIWNGYSKEGLKLIIATEEGFQKNSFNYILETY